MDTNCYMRLDRFLDHWQGVRWVTVRTLHAFTDEDLGYRLVPSWRTVGELFHHIAAHQYYVARGVLVERWDPEGDEVDLDWAAHRAAVCNSRITLEHWLIEAQEKLAIWASDTDSSRLEEVRDDNPWHEGMRGWLLLHHAYQDELHHRGQLFAIARVLGRVPPMVYAEEHPEFWHTRKGK